MQPLWLGRRDDAEDGVCAQPALLVPVEQTAIVGGPDEFAAKFAAEISLLAVKVGEPQVGVAVAVVRLLVGNWNVSR
jgi:hypothetical protein